jgi:hypothetical protein
MRCISSITSHVRLQAALEPTLACMVTHYHLWGSTNPQRFRAHENRGLMRNCRSKASKVKLDESFPTSELGPNANYKDTRHLTYAGVGRRSGMESFMTKRALGYTTSQFRTFKTCKPKRNGRVFYSRPDDTNKCCILSFVAPP